MEGVEIISCLRVLRLEIEDVRRFNDLLYLLGQVGPKTLRPSHSVDHQRDNVRHANIIRGLFVLAEVSMLDIQVVSVDQRMDGFDILRWRILGSRGSNVM